MANIVSVEDDKDLQDLLKYSLKSFGYSVSVYDSAESFFDDKHGDVPDLILMDIMLPGMDGMDALKKIKRDPKLKHIPVLMLTAKSAEYSIAQGLEEGADDYIVKPFGVIELSARIKANLRKHAKTRVVESDGIKLDISAREAYLDGAPLKLTLKEFGLLQTLIGNSGAVQEREKLLENLWGADFLGETRTLDMHIMTLRNKLGKYADRIVTVRGIGYKYTP
jgi:two-component system alkaline phosphatase synthesis response regulator PhoP